MALRPTLNFAGNAADVIAHYQAALGGETEIVHFAGSPAAEFVPPDWAEKIIYGRVRSPFGDVDVMDAPPGRASPIGGNVAISIDVADETDAARIFAKLADGGNVLMPFEDVLRAQIRDDQ
jgi:PhnB protein